jgi:hypothetical protein
VDVALVTCTDAVAFDPRLPKLQLKTPLEIAHVPGPLYAGLIDQLTPVPEGSVSLKVAEVAEPDPVLLTATVNPIDDPAATVAASAVFVTLNAGHCTVVEAEACKEALSPAVSVALLE